MRKRCWKTVLSAILASAMLITSTPANLSMTVQAQEPGVEDTLSVLTEQPDENEPEDDQTGQDSGEDQDVQNPVGTNTVETTDDEGGDDTGSAQTPGTTTDNNDTPDTNDNNNGNGEQTTPKVNATTGAVVNDDKTVTFTCVASEIEFKDGNNGDTVVATDDLMGIWVKSSANGWSGALATLQKGTDGVWTGTSAAITEPGTYQWLFMGGTTSDNIYSTSGNKTFQILAEGETPIVSPVITGRNVKFLYKNADASDVKLAGNMTDWQASETLTKNSEGIWEVTLEDMTPGNYQYKFVITVNDAESWVLDPNNANVVNKNSAFTIAGLGDAATNAKANGTTILPAEIETYYSADGSVSSKAVTYALTDDSTGKGVTLGEQDGQQTVTAPSTLNVGDKFTLTATSKENASDTCTVTVTLVPVMPDPTVQSPVPGKGEATFYYYAPKPETELVRIKGAMTGDSWPTVDMEYDEDTGYWSVTLKMAPGTYEYGYAVYAQGADLTGQGDFKTDPLNADKAANGNSLVTVTEGSGEVSPVIEGKKVTFIYENEQAAAVYVAGTMSGWGDTVNSDAYKLTKNADSGRWELTKEMPAGSYAYKYIYLLDGDPEQHWANDPLNPNKASDGNNTFVVAGLEDLNIEVERGGKKAELAATLKLYDETGATTDSAVTYDLSAETAAEKYKNKIELTTEAGKTLVSLKSDFPADVEEFTLTATDADSNTSTVNVSVVDKKYKYTIYYYDADHYNEEKPLETAGLWIYSEGVNGTLYNFSETEVLDGNTWLKAEVDLSFTDLSIIPRNYGPVNPWVWQDETRTFVNEEEADEVTLYIVFDDGHRIYTEKPKTINFAKRYVVAEYEREDAIENWKLYTWNSGYGNDIFADFTATDSKNGLAQVRIRRGLESLSFCLAKIVEGIDGWADQDGGDYLVDVPERQNVVKIQIKQGQGIVKTYPYNTGYEMAPADNMIHFYYRDDAAFLTGSEGGHTTVALEIGTLGEDGKLSVESKPMTYNTDEQRYFVDYDLEDVTKAATYYYRYYLDGTTYVTDDFNDQRETIEEKEYSVLEYDMLDTEMEAELQNDTMDYNDNNVLKIKVNAKNSDGEPIEDTEELNIVKKATVNLSALGGGAATEIDPELLAISIAVKQGTSAGEKTLPITIEDVYGNEHKTEAKVTVVDRNKGADFDWDEAVVYFAVTDRFFDGNSSNNDGGVPGSYDPDTNGGLNSSYHGGDFAGLTQKLDYLQDLGVNTIWITPIVENQTGANSVDDPTVKEAWGYTGYWTKDFTKIDAHLGTEAEFSALLDAAHAKGMKVMVDVVLNHTGYGDDITNYFNSNFKNEDGETIKMLRGDDEVVNGHDQKSSLAGLPDFLTENPEVRELVVEWQSNWISRYPIDYYRVDTVKHVDDTTWSAFKNALTEINPDFKMIGEWAGAGYATDTGMLNTGRMDALLDFDFPKQAANFVAGDLSGVEGFLSARNGAIDNTASLGAWLSNHDQMGFVRRLVSEKGKTEEEAKQLALVAASLQLTAKGQVYIYYGEEIGESNGEENYPYQTNRKDFDWSKVTGDNQALAHYKKMLSIRNMYSELFAKGSRETVSTDSGLDVFKRSYGGTTLTVALNITGAEQTYTLSGQTPGMAVIDYYSGTQYPVDESGNAVINVPAAADGGTVVLGTENFRMDLQEGMQIKRIPDQTYTGLSIKLPEDVLQVYDGTTRLAEGIDYTVSYKNNKAVGTATVTIKGKGNYKMSETAQFNIVPKNVAELGIEYKDVVIANGSVQKPLSKITNNGKKLAAKEYQVVYYQLSANGQKTQVKGVKEVGEYEMVITGLNNYTGTVTKAVSVKDTGTYMSKLRITLEYTSKEYTGSALEPQVTVKNGSEPVADTCYTVSYSNNTNVGKANVIITGVSAEGYYGSVTKTFKITGTELSKVAQVDTAKWQAKLDIDPIKGNAEQANAVLTAKRGQSVTLTKGKDYTVSYSNNTRPGTATVTFTGAGKYTGTIKKTFKINAIKWVQTDLGNNLLVTVDKTAPYSKKGAKPGVTVTYKNKRLTEGKDYKLTYINNKAVADADAAKKPSVAVTGTGSFSGKVNADAFSIVKADLSDWKTGFTMTVPDAVYSDQKGNFISEPVVKDADGTRLIKDTDYKVTYYAMVNGDWVEQKQNDGPFDKGTRLKVEVTGKGNYENTISKEYKMVAASIRKATIIAKAQTYTGKAITLDANDFSKAKLGRNKLTYGVDYEIVPGSYEKNVNKGTASVTIRGIGNYGDEKKVTFRITSSIMRWWWNLFS